MASGLTAADLRPTVLEFAKLLESYMRSVELSRDDLRGVSAGDTLVDLRVCASQLDIAAWRGPGEHMTPVRLAAARLHAMACAADLLGLLDIVGALDVPEGSE